MKTDDFSQIDNPQPFGSRFADFQADVAVASASSASASSTRPFTDDEDFPMITATFPSLDELNARHRRTRVHLTRTGHLFVYRPDQPSWPYLHSLVRGRTTTPLDEIEAQLRDLVGCRRWYVVEEGSPDLYPVIPVAPTTGKPVKYWNDSWDRQMLYRTIGSAITGGYQLIALLYNDGCDFPTKLLEPWVDRRVPNVEDEGLIPFELIEPATGVFQRYHTEDWRQLAE